MRDIFVSGSTILITVIFLFITSRNVLPNSSLYKVKRATEYLEELPAFSTTDKLHLYYSFLDRRFNEFTGLVDDTETYAILAASSRYSATAGKIKILTLETGSDEMINQTISKLKSHQSKFEELLTSPTINSYNEKHILEVINYLDLYIQELTSTQTSSNHQ